MSETKQPERPWWLNDPWYGMHLFAENRARFPVDEVLKYNGRFVAWYPDGSGIHDSDEDRVAPGCCEAELASFPSSCQNRYGFSAAPNS